MKFPMIDQTGKKIKDIELNENVFGAKVSMSCIHLMVLNYLANRRQGTQSTLTRTEVRGGGRKPWRQKGTGRARQGSIRAPQWRHGGVALGPKPRSYRFSVNKKVRALAMRSVLTSKLADKQLIVVDKISYDEIKTKLAVEMLKSMNIEGKALIVAGSVDSNFVKSAKNIQNVKTAVVTSVNVYDMLKYDTLVLTQDAVRKLEEVYA
ncbi:MAG: 50S ribosomal protein L4 [Clostridiales bacterium]|nr:50S ribosomal protein L4 [Clostridiales bacterium]